MMPRSSLVRVALPCVLTVGLMSCLLLPLEAAAQCRSRRCQPRPRPQPVDTTPPGEKISQFWSSAFTEQPLLTAAFVGTVLGCAVYGAYSITRGGQIEPPADGPRFTDDW